MSKALRTKIIKYLVTIVIGAACVISYLSAYDLSVEPEVERYRILTDAFSLPGIFMILVGLLIKMNNLGALDTIAYGFSFVIHMIIPGWFGKMEKYLDYVEARREKRVTGYGFLFVVGGILFGISLVFVVLFYRALG